MNRERALSQLKSLSYTLLTCVVMAGVLYGVETGLFAQRGWLERFPRPLLSWAETAGVLFLLALALKPRGFFASVVAIGLLGYLQWLHLAYFGTFIQPNSIYLTLTNMGEVFETARGFVGQILIPTLVFVLQMALLREILKRLRPQTNFVPALKWVLILVLLYAPVRTAVTGNTYGKQPPVHGFGFSNMYGSFSYFFGKILPFKLTHRSAPLHLEPLPVETLRPQRHVILIMGESLRFDNMSLFGYHRPTTPHLDRLLADNKLIARKGFSGGVSTDVALPMFFNGHQGYDAAPVIISQKRCLFALAQANGFGTRFFSAQSQTSLSHILNYICPQAIDHLQVGAPLGADEEKMGFNDEILIDAIKAADLSTPQFIVLHQRGSHSPYDLRYPRTAAVFLPEKGDSYEIEQIKHYDNTVHYTDWVLSEVLKDIEARSKLPFDLVFTSDHGEALGEGGVWGHVMLNEFTHHIPFVFYSSDSKNAAFAEASTWPEFTNHQQISRLLMRMLGYRPPPPAPSNTFLVMGSDMDGLNGAWLFDFSVQPPVRIPEPDPTK
ncbi:MAG: phosphoethanolamine transferase [Bdellovibrionaceae bacterium]|nr:phosphoethanolamine transferase [Pseudobdellovibrionaceae bacterium]